MNTSLKISDFRTKVADLARPNRFTVSIVAPSEVTSTAFAGITLTDWLVQSASIPARTQGEAVLKYHGMELKLPADYSKENLTVTFLNSYGWEGRGFFDHWMESYMQSVSGRNNRKDAMSIIDGTSVTVHQLGRTLDDILASYKFNDVFPTNVSEIELNMGSNDAIETFTVSFAYSYWEKINVTI